MHTEIIIIHVASMLASLVVMPTAIALALRGITSSVKVATAGISLTGIGFVSGAVLLFDAPLFAECAVLTAYLGAMIVVYAYGFAWGVESKARLLAGRE